MIVAHPDDETLWAGSTIAAKPGTGVLCMTNRSDRVRRTAFHRAMSALGARGAILDIPDRRSEPPTPDDESRMGALVDALLGGGRVSEVFTHGPEGEYGHVLHRAVSRIVTARTAEYGVDLWYFDFADPDQPDGGLGIPAPKQRALDAYFPPDRSIPDSDRTHMRLSALERPVPARDYAGPSRAVSALYGPGSGA